jgi:hypothetical protein
MKSKMSPEAINMAVANFRHIIVNPLWFETEKRPYTWNLWAALDQTTDYDMSFDLQNCCLSRPYLCFISKYVYPMRTAV